ncbi:hypothetical protein ACVLV4_001774 [Rathayibacter agropyri]
MSDTDESYVALNLELRIPNFDPRIGDEVITRVAQDVGGTPWWFLRYWQSGPHIRFRALRREDVEIIMQSVTTSYMDCMTSSWKGVTVLTDREYRDATFSAARQGEGYGELESLPLAPLGVHVRPFESEETRYGGVQRYRAAIRAFAEIVNLDIPTDGDERIRPSAPLSNSPEFVLGSVVKMMDRIIGNSRPDGFEHVDPRLAGPTVTDVLKTGFASIHGTYLRSIIHTTCNRLGLAVEAERSLRRTALDLVDKHRRPLRRDDIK